jgi:hypothetical protein
MIRRLSTVVLVVLAALGSLAVATAEEPKPRKGTQKRGHLPRKGDITDIADRKGDITDIAGSDEK